MRENNKKRATIWKYLLSTLIIILYLLPLFVLVTMSFKPITDTSSRLSLPSNFYMGNYKKLLAEGKIVRSFINTVIITVFTIVFEIIIASMAAYPLARNKSRMNNFVKTIIMGVMMIPPLSILVGVYSILVSMGAISTYWGIIIVSVSFGLPMPIFLYSNFMVTIPRSLDEVSAIDGCNTIQTFFYIIFPQLKPVTVTIIILNGVAMWNEYAYSLYILQKAKMYTLTLMTSQYFSSSSANNLNGAAAAACISIMPVVLAYLFLQKYFIQSRIDSAVKG